MSVYIYVCIVDHCAPKLLTLVKPKIRKELFKS